MEQNKIQQFIKIFEKYSAVKLVYIFGSQVTGKTGPLSDYDFAVYLEENDPKVQFLIKTKLLDELSRVLGSDKLDLVVLNTVQGSELKYNIISQGKLIYQQEPYKLSVEPKILNEYFDYKYSLIKSGIIA
jgi:uncharacterized protein